MSITCTQCGQSFDPSDVVTIRGFPVCISCKPLLLKKIQEGDMNYSGFVYKGFWIRGVAEGIDALILGIAAQSIDIFFRFLGFETVTDPFSAFSIFSLAISFLINIVYYVFFNGRYGATPGKMVIGAKIVNTDGSPISYTKAFARFFAEMLSGIIFGIGYIMAAFDSQKRALHDRICSTLVIKG